MERRPQPTKAESNTDLAKPWQICSEEETQSQWQRETRCPLESDESLGSNATCNIPPVFKRSLPRGQEGSSRQCWGPWGAERGFHYLEPLVGQRVASSDLERRPHPLGGKLTGVGELRCLEVRVTHDVTRSVSSLPLVNPLTSPARCRLC